VRGIVIAGLLGAACALAIGWVLVKGLPWKRAPGTASAAPTTTASSQPAGADAKRKIRANLFYVSEDGLRLQAVEREVPYGEDTAAQARLLVEEQLKPAPSPLAQALAPGTALRALFLTPRGDAFVDLTRDATNSHTGGSLDELFAVYAVVNVLTVNLPAISRVQILVDGHEVDTLAGHIDLRTPLQKSMKWVAAPGAPASPGPTSP
jgi:Sporulation and spore germination